jgi:peptide subunit release factor 1 (eRF1)
MIAPQVAMEVKKRLEGIEAPMLSLYLDVNPANPENERRGFIIRAKDAMREAGIPKELSHSVEDQLSRSETKPQGRTLVLFLSEDESTVSESFHLQTELPLTGAVPGAIARWGKPYFTPLLLAMSYQHRYGIVHITSRSWRFFETYLGEIEEGRDAFRQLDITEWRELSEGAVGQPDVPARGGQGKEKFERRLQEQTHRLYNQAATSLEAELQTRNLDRLILLGTHEQVAQFSNNLPKHLAHLVVGTGRHVDSADPSVDRILSAAEPAIQAHESEEAESLLHEIAERGVSGREAVIDALGSGRLHILALPWDSPNLDEQLYRCTVDGAVHATKKLAAKNCPDAAPEPVRFGDVLPDLVTEQGTNVRFLTGEYRQALIDSYGGLAGLPRWVK